MLGRSRICLRYRTAWRELLHPLPARARRMQWMKRDAVELNEELLRRPYYTIKSYNLPCTVGTHGGAVARRGGLHSSFSVDELLQQPRRVSSPERLQALREQLQFPGVVGPAAAPPLSSSSPPPPTEAAGNYANAYGARLRPRYPESWDTVPPHQPSRDLL